MEYNVEELSPVKRKVVVKVPAEEVNAAIDAAVAMFKKDLKLSGFRKGKVPSYIVESRFKDDIYKQAETDLLNVHFNEILGELNLRPVSELNLDPSEEFKRGGDFNYSFTFEIKPEIELPEYHGLKVKQKKVEIKDEQVDRAIENLRNQYAKYEVVKEDRTPQKGDKVVVSFKLYDGDKFLEDVSQDFFEFFYGVGDALEDFEKLIADLVPGGKNQGEITFPEDFLNKSLAGKKIRAEVELHSIKEKVLPELDEEFLSKFGMSSVEELRETVAKNLKRNIEDIEKSFAQKKLLDEIVEKVDVVLPDSLVEKQIQSMVEKERDKLERQGKDPDTLGSEEELKEKFRPEAELIVKSQLILLEIAEKEELTVTNEEVEQKIAMTAYQMGLDPQILREFYIKNNLMFALRDSILADKAMEKVYEYAEIEYEEDTEDKESSENKGEEDSSADKEE
ncbi:trigger factor [Desulfothermus sp.]